jgi:3-phosphoshikimate 1-carboxyvinyltransferase
MHQFGVRRRRGFVRPSRTTIAHQAAKGGCIDIDADASSAVYWCLAVRLVRGSRIAIPSLDPHSSPQPDLRAIWALDRFSGATYPDGPETGLIVAATNDAHGARLDCVQFPDGAIALATAAASARSASRLSGLRTLRVKETDRIAALANELRKVGCTVETGDDWIAIDPSTRHDKPVTIETYNDHRMAMAFAVLGLARPGISIRNPKCVAKSYPTFWRDFAKLYQ